MDMGRGQGSGKWTREGDKSLVKGQGKRTRLRLTQNTVMPEDCKLSDLTQNTVMPEDCKHSDLTQNTVMPEDCKLSDLTHNKVTPENT